MTIFTLTHNQITELYVNGSRAGEEYWKAAQLLPSTATKNEYIQLINQSAECFSMGKDFLRAGKVMETGLRKITADSERFDHAQITSMVQFAELCFFKCGMLDISADLLYLCAEYLIKNNIGVSQGILLIKEAVTLLETERRPYQAVMTVYKAIKLILDSQDVETELNQLIKTGLNLALNIHHEKFIFIFSFLLLVLQKSLDDFNASQVPDENEGLINKTKLFLEDCSNQSLLNSVHQHPQFQGLDLELKTFFQNLYPGDGLAKISETNDFLKSPAEFKDSENENHTSKVFSPTTDSKIRTASGQFGKSKQIGKLTAIAAVAASSAAITSGIAGVESYKGSRGSSRKPGKEDLKSSVFTDINGVHAVHPEAVGMTNSQFREAQIQSSQFDDLAFDSILQD